jgi:ribosomal protein S18 acetylase RimI-like enzyme
MKTCNIRPLRQDECDILSDFLYEAIYQKEGDTPLSRVVISNPELEVYIKDFGKKDDYCLVAEVDGEIIGAVWTRITFGEVKGQGYVDDQTPEFAVSLYREYRNRGIGLRLMKKMLNLLKIKGYSQASLSVDKENYAVKLYRDLGFRVYKDTGKDYVMVYDLE